MLTIFKVIMYNCKLRLIPAVVLLNTVMYCHLNLKVLCSKGQQKLYRSSKKNFNFYCTRVACRLLFLAGESA
jgi:hypothetical protein